MVGRGHGRLVPGLLHHGGDLASVGGDDQAIRYTRLNHASDDPEDERFACQREERLARETAGAQPRWNDTEDGHGGTYKIRAVASSPGPKWLRRGGLGHYKIGRAHV